MTPHLSDQGTLVLVDAPDDGMDERCWIEATIEQEVARRQAERFNPDPDLLRIVADDLAAEHLLDPEDGEGNWRPCSAETPGARRFWRFTVVDRDDLIDEGDDA